MRDGFPVCKRKSGAFLPFMGAGRHFSRNLLGMSMEKRFFLSAGVVAFLALNGVAIGGKRVVVDQSSQTLRAYEDGALVFRARVSTGKRGKETPGGRFRARYKERMHYSSRYHHAPMPYSVNIGGHYFIHGFSSVPSHPASHVYPVVA